MSNSYIVLLKPYANLGNHMGGLPQQGVASSDSSSSATIVPGYEYEHLNGYSATFSEDLARQISENPDVEGVFPDTTVKIQMIPNDGKEMDDEISSQALESGLQALQTTWGLQRISQAAPLPPKSRPQVLQYAYDEKPSLNETKAQVNCYIVDTGVKTDHQDFGGRAKWGKTFPAGGSRQDNQGHGTHVAATVAGSRWGVAKTANIIAVKVLGDDGTGSTSDIVAGINWCIDEHQRTGGPSVINMSLGGGPSRPLNEAATRAVEKGIHVICAAGNDGDDVADSSPASADKVITVGASHIRDERSNFSNWGEAVDIFAPGSTVISAGITSRTAYIAHDGTSMASPHVAGVVAHHLRDNPTTSPAQMLTDLQGAARSGILQNIYQQGTPNLLLQV